MLEAHFGKPLVLAMESGSNPQSETYDPKWFERYVLFSMLVQAEGLKFAIEHYRRRKFECSGCLFWQWNDSWPGISWSVLDYYLRPKASWYYVKRAYAPVMASLRWHENALEVRLVNDTLQRVECPAELVVMDFSGKVQWREHWDAFAEANSSQLSLRVENPPLTGFGSIVAIVRTPTNAFPLNTLLLKEFGELELPVPTLRIEAVPVEAAECCYDARLLSDAYAHFVHLTAPVPEACFSDNYFPLLPGEPQVIRVKSAVSFAVDELQAGWFSIPS